MKPLTQTYEFVNTNTNTRTFAYPKDVKFAEKETHFLPEEIENADGFIVSYPFNQPYPIVAHIQNDFIQLCIDRDCYEIELQFVHLIADIAEIYWDTEDVTLVREYLTKYYHQNQTK